MKSILRLLILFLGSLFLVSLLIFFIVHLTPGNIAEIHNLSSATAHVLHLDQPLVLQYLFWLRDCLGFNFGLSLVDGSSVSKLLWDYAPPTLALTFGSVLVSLILSLPVGLLMGLRPASRTGKLIGSFVYTISSIPVFVLGYIVLAIVFGGFHFYSTTPPEGAFKFWPWFSYYLLPILVLAIGNGTMGEFVRFISLETQNINRAMYIKAARARGSRLTWHFFRSMILPIFNIVVSNIAVLLGGLVVVERIFNFHGLGWLSWEATLKRDFFVIMGITLLMAFIVRSFMFINDLMALWLDPRLQK